MRTFRTVVRDYLHCDLPEHPVDHWELWNTVKEDWIWSEMKYKIQRSAMPGQTSVWLRRCLNRSILGHVYGGYNIVQSSALSRWSVCPTVGKESNSNTSMANDRWSRMSPLCIAFSMTISWCPVQAGFTKPHKIHQIHCFEKLGCWIFQRIWYETLTRNETYGILHDIYYTEMLRWQLYRDYAILDIFCFCPPG